MPQQINAQAFEGPHPTCRDFVDRLRAWGFAPRKDEGVHTIYRGPHGGTLRVPRSQMGRADLDQAAKAARLVGVTSEQFWVGPKSAVRETAAQPATQEPATPMTASGRVEIDQGVEDPVVELFGRLFPSGVQMTADLLRDLQNWTHLTNKLTRHAESAARLS
ncbi:hypothetical protein [Nonomuraea sp. NPDC048901]|uniref:hypothetical protein n=1 Tax=Nonomuraea sp. NPDC048901 TaxID=3155627 RepID=UPI00340AF265